MESAVSTVLAGNQLTAWDAFGDLAVLARLQTEPEDRSPGRRRFPQQPESLAAAGGNFQLIL